MMLRFFGASVAMTVFSAVHAADALETVVITAPALTVETRIDRKIYSIASDPQSTFGALSDVLGVIPSVSVDADGAVSLRGDSKVLILIDGRPSAQFAGASAGEALQSIPAKNIERIEVLTTPPPQYKAAGSAGVINIILRHDRAPGTTGSAQASIGNSGRLSAGGELGFRSEAWTTALTAFARRDYRQRTTDSRVTLPGGVSTSSLDEQLRRMARTASLSSEYALSEERTLSGAVTLGSRGGPRAYTQQNLGTTGATLTRSSQRVSEGHDPENNDDEKLGFTQKLSRPGETLDLSLHRSRSLQSEYYLYTDTSLVPLLTTAFNDLAFSEDGRTLEANADYVLPISGSTFKLGYAFEEENYRFRSEGNQRDPLTRAPTANPFLSDDFAVRRVINAGYASWQRTQGDWGWLVGVRAEQTQTSTNQRIDAIRDARSDLRVYPGVHVTRSLSDSTTLAFGASRRVSRPDTDDLNPHVDYEYAPELQSGNPDLRPQDTQSFELGFDTQSPRLSYGATGYYRVIRNSTTQVTQYLGNGQSLTTRANLPRSDAYGAEFNVSTRLRDKLTLSISGDLFHNQIDAPMLGLSGLQSSVGVNGKAKLDWRPTAADSAQITATRTDERLTPQGTVSAINIVNIGYRRELQSNLAAVLTVSDVFNAQRSTRTANALTFSEDYRRATQGRLAFLGLTYSFGAEKSGKPASFEYEP